MELYKLVVRMTDALRVIELFAGIGAQRMALTLEGIPHTVVAICEIDAHALASYEAIHGDCPNLGDITKVERLPPCDLVTYSFPCQDLSIAGKRKGMGEGTRSGLVWEVMCLLERESPSGMAPDGERPDGPDLPPLAGAGLQAGQDGLQEQVGEAGLLPLRLAAEARQGVHALALACRPSRPSDRDRRARALHPRHNGAGGRGPLYQARAAVDGEVEDRGPAEGRARRRDVLLQKGPVFRGRAGAHGED